MGDNELIFSIMLSIITEHCVFINSLINIIAFVECDTNYWGICLHQTRGYSGEFDFYYECACFFGVNSKFIFTYKLVA